MNTQLKKSTQIFLGILSGLGIWTVGILMSGGITLFLNDYELYSTGKLILAFPFLFVAACIIIAKYSARTENKAYYITSMISFLFPFISFLLHATNIFAAGLSIPVISNIAEIFVILFLYLSSPAFSVAAQIFNATSIDAIAVILCVAFALIGMVVSVFVYKRNCDK